MNRKNTITGREEIYNKTERVTEKNLINYLSRGNLSIRTRRVVLDKREKFSGQIQI